MKYNDHLILNSKFSFFKLQLIQLRKVSAKVLANTSSNVNTTTDVQPSKQRDNTTDQQRHGASAYIDQSEYDSYKQPTVIKKQDEPTRGTYSNYPQTTTNENNKTRPVYNQDKNEDDYVTEHTQQQPQYPQQQQYTKPSSTVYPGLLGRSGSNNGLQTTQGQSRITSAKQRNPSAGSNLYPVIY